MAADSSSAPAGRSSSGATVDSYVGSLISLTSKSEIRYEGILYNINTDESSIGLRNVRSFGTEGRKTDGPQVPPSDKVYEYILFRGSDIKDLQVKSSPPAQAAPPLDSDPAIIQSHYSNPPLPSMHVPSTFSGSLSDLGSHTAQLGPHGSTFQGGLPLYQPGGNFSSWAPNANGSGLAMSMYWQGFYGTPNGVPQSPQHSLLQPPPGLSMPHSMQQLTYSSSSPASAAAPSLQGSNLIEYSSLLAPIASSSHGTSSSLPTSTYPVSIPTIQLATFPSNTSSLMLNKAPISGTPAISTVSLPTLALLAPVFGGDLNPVLPSLPSKSNTVPDPLFQYQVKRQPVTTVAVTTSPPLITPRQLLQLGPASVSLNQSSQTAQKDVEVVQVSATLPEPPAPSSIDNQAPILPLPPSEGSYKLSNGASFRARFKYRGRSGRGNGISRPMTRFSKDFDFEAMNEKFNKDEVWGHLGKSNKQSMEKDGNEFGSYEDYSQDEFAAELPKADVKPVYKKDDFFDSLSSSSIDNEPNHGRIRFSEQMKIDTETFGDFHRYRGGRGGRGPYRGGRSSGSSYGRGYSYNYAVRGRGQGVSGRGYLQQP